MSESGNSNLLCNIITVGEKGVHNPWRICSNCGSNIETVSSHCSRCDAKIAGFIDKYIRKKTIVLD